MKLKTTPHHHRYAFTKEITGQKNWRPDHLSLGTSLLFPMEFFQIYWRAKKVTSKTSLWLSLSRDTLFAIYRPDLVSQVLQLLLNSYWSITLDIWASLCICSWNGNHFAVQLQHMNNQICVWSINLHGPSHMTVMLTSSMKVFCHMYKFEKVSDFSTCSGLCLVSGL